MFDVIGEVLVQEDVSEDEEQLVDFGGLIALLQYVGHSQFEDLLDVVDGNAYAAEVIDQLLSSVQHLPQLVYYHRVLL